MRQILHGSARTTEATRRAIQNKSRVELDRLKQRKDKLEREQRKLLEAHYAAAVPLDLLKEEQERIGRSLKGITTQIEANQSESAELTNNFNDVFELLEDCGLAYRLAGDFERRCFDQALFKRILVHKDLTLEGDYAEPFDAQFNPNVFELTGTDEGNTKESEGQSTATRSLLDIFRAKNTYTCTNFFCAGVSMSIMCHDFAVDIISHICNQWPNQTNNSLHP